MAKLKDKIENALNETRILVLGIQILIGFGYRSFFEPGFQKMAHYDQRVALASLALMLLGLAVIVVPVSYHRIVLHGRDTARLHRLATATVSSGLLPFAISMALSFYVGLRFLAAPGPSAAVAVALLCVTLFFWYGLEILARKRKMHALHLYAMFDPSRGTDMSEEEKTDLTTRVKQVLIECRVVLPGAQALLGFQLIIMWMTEFYKMPLIWKLLHLASLVSIAMCTILLITPAAYHRIVEQGNDSETLHHFTSRVLLWAMLFLALGVCGDFYVVCRLTGLGMVLSTMLALALLAFFTAAWFGYAVWKKQQLHDPALTSSHLRHRPVA
jgi:hypothetical protein